MDTQRSGETKQSRLKRSQSGMSEAETNQTTKKDIANSLSELSDKLKANKSQAADRIYNAILMFNKQYDDSTTS
jgi:hypothetical protein